ncbi:PTS sugar transporter subunit IIC [Levilactobacillus enshiensis]|uniref:PTS sugar transporter subunit IIC n=1 Tax=Levilactobacillus enshiensis TaxID=2590213 RepID=UPI00117BB26E|nr:PTS sugar transporter subunit IIC [Levilactobacillus enshiensis]
MDESEKVPIREFWDRILSGMAIAIVAAVTPSALISPFINGLAPDSVFWGNIDTIANLGVYTVPVVSAILAANKFNCTMVEKASISLAALAASGAVSYQDGQFVLLGMGDIINTLLVIAIAIFVARKIRKYIGSFAIFWDPIICGVVVGAIGTWLYTYVHLISVVVGQTLKLFTSLQPTLMCMLIAMTFAVIVSTPLSSVGLGVAIGISGVAGGAAAVGVTSCFIMVAVGTFTSNKKGIPLVMFFGGVKMMLVNFAKHPRMLIPIALVGMLSGLTDSLVRLKCDSQFAGFGFPVGPINSFSYMDGSTMSRLAMLAIVYFIMPIIYSMIVYNVLQKIPRLNLLKKTDWVVCLED